MSNYPKADAIIEEMYKDKKLCECMILEKSGDDTYRVFSGIGNVASFKKMFSLEVIWNEDNYYIPTAGFIERKDFPELANLAWGDNNRAIVNDEKVIKKILNKL